MQAQAEQAKSNFDFLNNDALTGQYYSRAHQAEQAYADGLYSSVLTSSRVLAENLAKDIADQNFIDTEGRTFNDILHVLKKGAYIPDDALQLLYDLKGSGNIAAHTLEEASQSDALKALKKIYKLLVWFVAEFYDENVEADFKEPRKAEFLYQTTSKLPEAGEKNIIYIQTADNSSGKFSVYEGNQKVGKTAVGDLAEDNSDNSPYLRAYAQKRIQSYMNTSGVPFKLEWSELAYRKSDGFWFSDHDVHRVLERSGIKHSKILTGREWFETDLETCKRAIKAVKQGKDTLDKVVDADKSIVLRPEQNEAITKTIAGFKTGEKMLWNAKMRFGKTLTALELVRQKGYKKVLIMTHRPVVDEGWFDDFKKIGMPDAGYVYGSKKKGHKSVASLEELGKPYVYFASIQDLAGSEMVGGKVSNKNQDLFGVHWDLVIVDEAHEGTQTELTQSVLQHVIKKRHTKELDLSGTPFNILSDYDDDHVFTWDYTMEQTAKDNWSSEHPGVKNPYQSLPKVSMFTFEMNKHFKDPRLTGEGLDKYSFNFKEFFKTDKNGKFVYEDYVRQFLDNITNPGQTNYPFSTRQFRNNLRHTLWILPGIKECNALEDLLKKHPVFGKEYNILNVVRHDASDTILGTDNDVKAENKAIAAADREHRKTVTLTVRKLTTGATVPEWTGVLFLSNTNSAMQYLQAAFRAQTPYSSPEFGRKENCYIFDFAPDRALTVMAESSNLATGLHKIQTKDQKQRMAKLLHFLPIIGESNQQMKPYKVDKLLAKIKRAYAEKAVRTGFDDDSIYSDRLLMIKDADLQKFNDLKGIVGTTKKEKQPLKVDVNNQGLTEAEYDKAEKGSKKKPKERTPEEQAAIDKAKKLKKQRKTMISILRGVSIRIPMMIYGMDIEFDEDVSIKKFVDSIDDVSWQEFMPKGVTKELFNEFVKYYDADVFIEAGKIIRRKVKELDKEDPLERVEKIADIFGTFKNPDKETVLTPWRVVNMHLGQTIGGLSFFDDNYENQYQDGNVIRRWIQKEYTDKTLTRDAHVLEINSKTGLYPLYVATSIYWREFTKLNDQTAGKFSFEDELLLWQTILRENIFLIAKTPMAKEIARRTLTGYHSDWELNDEYVANIVEDSKNSSSDEAKKIERLFGNMKFDVVIGNPPYESLDGGAQASATPIYNEFVNLSQALNANIVSLIIPARWYTGGKGLDGFRAKMLRDKHIKALYDYKNPEDVFPHTNIRGGVCIFIWDKYFDNTENDTKVVTIEHRRQTNVSYRKLDSLGLGIFIRDEKTFDILRKVRKGNSSKFIEWVSVRKPFGLGGTFIKNDEFYKTSKNIENPVKIYGKGVVGYTSRDNIIKNKKWIDNIKVLTARSNNIGTELADDNLNAFVAESGSACTETYLVIGADKKLNKYSAKNIVKYLKTKFVRYLISLSKSSQDASRKTYRFVPTQNFNEDSDIDWSQPVTNIDQQLFTKYKLSSSEILFIESQVVFMQ